MKNIDSNGKIEKKIFRKNYLALSRQIRRI
jgi:hypothetical protein